MVPSTRRLALGVAVVVAVAGGLAVALIPFQGELDGAVFGLMFLLPTVLGAAVGGFVAAVVGVTAGFMAYNFFFTEPYYTLAVSQLEDVVGLSVYVAVGTIVTLIVTREQRAARAAARREEEARTLFVLSRSLIVEHELDAVLHSIVSNVRSLFGVDTVAVLLVDGRQEQARVAALDGERMPDDELRGLLSNWQAPTAYRPSDHTNAQVVPLMAGDRRVGAFVIAGNVQEIPARLLTTFANQAAAAVERARLAEESMRVEVLEEVDRLRSALMGAVSHDLRSPLSSIAAAVSDLRDPEVELDAVDTDTLLATIEEETRRLDRLVGNVLDVSRIEGDALSLDLEAVEIDELIDEATRRMRLGSGNGTVELDLPPDLPPLAVDPTLVAQVLLNLLENAARYSPDGVPPRIVAQASNGWVEIRVQDAGPGIAEEDRERVFDLYYQVRDGEGSPDGTGLGLAICKGYVQAHGGSIWVEQTTGGGATVALRLPVVAEQDTLAPVDRT